MMNIFLEQSEIIEQLVTLNRHLMELLAQHTEVDKEEEHLRNIVQKNSDITGQAGVE